MTKYTRLYDKIHEVRDLKYDRLHEVASLEYDKLHEVSEVIVQVRQSPWSAMSPRIEAMMCAIRSLRTLSLDTRSEASSGIRSQVFSHLRGSSAITEGTREAL